MLILTLLLGLATPAQGQGYEDPLPTIAGPEADDLAAHASGHLVTTATGGRLEVVSLPDLQRRTLDSKRRAHGAVEFVSGPDREGRIAYVTNHMTEKVVRLKTIRLDGSEDTTVFQRPGDALWKHAVSAPALASSGGRIAVVWNANPGYHNDVIGPLEVWTLPNITKDAPESQAKLTTFMTASDLGLAWFPDGGRLAFVHLEPAPPPTQRSASFASAFEFDDGLPVVSILDVETGEAEPFHFGVHPLISPDGQWVLLQDAASVWWRVNLSDGDEQRVTWPGDWRGPIGLVSPEVLIYWGLPTEGSPVRYTRYGSPLVKKHAMGDIKIAELGTGKYRTLVQGVDPRDEVSFGAAAP